MGNEENRIRWISTELKKIPNGLKILDAGAGELRWKSSCAHLQYVSQDFCEYQGRGGNGVGLQHDVFDVRKVDIVSDIVDIPVKDREFDAVLCSEVLEHIPNPDLAIREFARVMKSGGELILTAPFCSLTHFAPYYFCNGFSPYWYEKHLQDNGFEIEEIVSNGNYLSYIIQELGRIEYVLKTYFGTRNLIVKLLATILKRTLSKYENQPNDSSELLCYGYFVRARKL